MPLEIVGCFEVRLESRRDDRGYFMRVYDRSAFAAQGLVTEWVQENQSLSRSRGTIRGLHYQRPPCAETKLVRVLSGEVLDVFVDLRVGSPTFGRWGSIHLTGENERMVYLPRGCAHGFCTLTDDVVIGYKVDSPYAPEHEGGIRWDDPNLGIDWPVASPILSERDRRLGSFDPQKSPFTFG